MLSDGKVKVGFETVRLVVVGYPIDLERDATSGSAAAAWQPLAPQSVPGVREAGVVSVVSDPSIGPGRDAEFGQARGDRAIVGHDDAGV